MRDRTSPATRAALVGVGSLALLALVALASRGRLGGGGGTTAAPSNALLSWAFSIFVVLYAIGAPFAIWAFVVARREETAIRGKRGRRGVFVVNVLVFLAFLGAALAIERVRHGHSKPIRLAPAIPKARPKLKPGQTAAKPAEPTFRWPVAAIAAAIGAAAIAAYLAGRRRHAAARPRAAAELALALDDAIDDVRAETDPRRAVLKAYARMEAVLAAHGVPRHEAEAPYEYLERALEQLHASAGSVERLTELFERARFSRHEIDSTMREDAIAALAAVRDEVAA